MVAKPKALIGIDGFIDHLYRVVDERRGPKSFSEIPTLQAFAKRIEGAEGKSLNVELSPIESKIGGNAPLMAASLSNLGTDVHLIGATDAPLFSSLKENLAGFVSLCKPGVTHALEFESGKLLLGVMGPILKLEASKVFALLCDTLEDVQALALVNWTMLPCMTEIWKLLAKNPPKSKIPLLIDLCDPKKRKKEELKEALEVLIELNASFEVILSLNLSEAEQILALFGQSLPGDPKTLCQEVRKALPLFQIVVHSREFAGAATEKESAVLDVPICPTPRLLTGAGDTFNGALLHKAIAKATLKEQLTQAVGAAGYYVRNGGAPKEKELYDFLDSWHNGTLKK